MPRQNAPAEDGSARNDAPPADPQTPGSDPAAEKKPCNTLPEVAAERDNDIVERIDVLVDHADIAGPDWIKDVLQTARQSIVDLRATAAAREPARPR